MSNFSAAAKTAPLAFSFVFSLNEATIKVLSGTLRVWFIGRVALRKEVRMSVEIVLYLELGWRRSMSIKYASYMVVVALTVCFRMAG